MSSTQHFIVDHIPSPIGAIRIVVDEQTQLRALDWDDYEDRMLRLLERHYGRGGVTLTSARAPASIREPIERYLAGDFDAVRSVPVATNGTAFQRGVWAQLREIPPGRTLSYGQLAARIGQPRAVRAVGLANGANPVAVVVPCHRVIGADGSLTGFGGGIERKRWLLMHEGAYTRQMNLLG